MKTIRIYRADGTGEPTTARGVTLESAIINAGRKIGMIKRGMYSGIGNMQDFAGGSTHHVQFGQYLAKINGTTLSSTYVVQELSGKS
jgi:hypothetical protein